MEGYGLQAHAGISYCHSAQENKSPDTYDWAFLVVLCILGFFLAYGSFLDVFMKDPHDKLHFVKSISKLCEYYSF